MDKSYAADSVGPTVSVELNLVKTHALPLALACLALVRTTFPAEVPRDILGLRLSLQFSTNVFVSGTPIHTAVVFENTTTNPTAVPFANPSSVELFVLNQNKEPLFATNRAIWHTYSGVSSVLLPAKGRREYHYELNNIFDMGMLGRYYVYAKAAKYRGPWQKLPQVQSATNEIMIVAPP